MALGLHSSTTAAAAENAGLLQNQDGAAEPTGGKVGHSSDNIMMQCLKHKSTPLHHKIRAMKRQEVLLCGCAHEESKVQ